MGTPRATPAPAKYDFHYCLHNGWLTDEVRALQNDFEGMKKKAEDFCPLGSFKKMALFVWEDFKRDDF